MKSSFGKSSGIVVEDIQHFKSTLAIVRPEMAINTRDGVRNFVLGDGVLRMKDRVYNKLQGMNEEQGILFSLDLERILEQAQTTHFGLYRQRMYAACVRGQKDLTSYDWDVLKSSLRSKLKELSSDVTLLYQAAVSGSHPIPPRVSKCGDEYVVRHLVL